MSKEIRIGILVAAAVLIFFAGFYFLKGSNVFSPEYEYHAYFDNVQGLQPSAIVQIKGLQVGKVSHIVLNRKNLDKPLDVIIAISKKTRLPRGTVAKLTSMDLLGTKGITLELGNSDELVEDGEQLPSAVQGGLLDNLSVEVSPLLQDLRKVVNTVDSLLMNVNQVLNDKARNDLQMSIASLHQAMDNFSEISSDLKGKGKALGRAIDNAESVTANLSRNNENIDQTLRNLRSTTQKLADAPLTEAIRNVDSMAANLRSIAQKINQNEGSLGLLVNDKALYQKLVTTVDELGKLSADLKAHPGRYINLTIFGRKARAAE